MLLFLFFLVAESTLLGSLVPSNATLPSKDLMKQIMADPKAFVAEVSKVDPAALQEIITLLEGLLETSEGQEQDLVNKVDDETTKALQSAEVLANAQTAVEDAQAALAAAEQEQEAASDAHDAQEQAKAVAEQEFADLSVGLDGEQEVIRQVIEMLQGLQGSASTEAPVLPDCENCVEINGRQYATMDFCPPDTPYGDSACGTCQSDLLPLPDGWQLASNDRGDVSFIAANYIFGTHVIVDGVGTGWSVKTFGSGIWREGQLQQDVDGDHFKPVSCSLKVLMMREA